MLSVNRKSYMICYMFASCNLKALMIKKKAAQLTKVFVFNRIARVAYMGHKQSKNHRQNWPMVALGQVIFAAFNGNNLI